MMRHSSASLILFAAKSVTLSSSAVSTSPAPLEPIDQVLHVLQLPSRIELVVRIKRAVAPLAIEVHPKRFSGLGSAKQDVGPLFTAVCCHGIGKLLLVPVFTVRHPLAFDQQRPEGAGRVFREHRVRRQLHKVDTLDDLHLTQSPSPAKSWINAAWSRPHFLHGSPPSPVKGCLVLRILSASARKVAPCFSCRLSSQWSTYACSSSACGLIVARPSFTNRWAIGAHQKFGRPRIHSTSGVSSTTVVSPLCRSRNLWCRGRST